MAEKEIREAIPFTIATNKISPDNSNQTSERSEWQKLQVSQERNWRKSQKNGEISHSHGLAELS